MNLTFICGIIHFRTTKVKKKKKKNGRYFKRIKLNDLKFRDFVLQFQQGKLLTSRSFSCANELQNKYWISSRKWLFHLMDYAFFSCEVFYPIKKRKINPYPRCSWTYPHTGKNDDKNWLYYTGLRYRDSKMSYFKIPAENFENIMLIQLFILIYAYLFMQYLCIFYVCPIFVKVIHNNYINYASLYSMGFQW